jgi:hypothetical protein
MPGRDTDATTMIRLSLLFITGVLTETAAYGAQGLTAPIPASRLVYPVDIRLTNREWRTLDIIRLNVIVREKKELFGGLKVRVFRGKIDALAAENQPGRCNLFESLLFRPDIQDVKRVKLRSVGYGL